MEGGNRLSVSMHSDIFVQIDVISITLCMPEAHQASTLETSIVNDAAEQALGIIKDLACLQTCRKSGL